MAVGRELLVILTGNRKNKPGLLIAKEAQFPNAKDGLRGVG